MELHNLRPAKGSTHKKTRLGRGQGSGKGGTSTKGHKGQKSRSGYKTKRGFEGGQMPIQMRLPKRGFKNINRVEYVPINLRRLQAVADKYGVSSINPEVLVEIGIVRKNDRVKILGSGELTGKIDVEAHAYSESAKKAIEAKGGNAGTISLNKPKAE